MSTPSSPSEIAPAEFAVSRAVARRAGRTVFAVQDEPRGGRRLTFDRPSDSMTLAYTVDHNGTVRLGPAGRLAPAAGPALVRDARRIAPGELAAARDYALITGRTVFVAEPDDRPSPRLSSGSGTARDSGRATGSTMHFAPPLDGTLRYAVRVSGEIVVGDAALAERSAAIADPGWAAYVAARLRQLRRLRERATELAPLRAVRPHDWSRVARLIPDDARTALHPAAWVGARGADAAHALLAAADRELERLRAQGGTLVRYE